MPEEMLQKGSSGFFFLRHSHEPSSRDFSAGHPQANESVGTHALPFFCLSSSRNIDNQSGADGGGQYKPFPFIIPLPEFRQAEEKGQQPFPFYLTSPIKVSLSQLKGKRAAQAFPLYITNPN